MKITLLSGTATPVELLFCLWWASRQPNPFPFRPDVLCRYLMGDDGPLDPDRADKDFLQRVNEAGGDKQYATREELKADVNRTFCEIVDAGIPVAENVQFVFLLEGVSISLREQMVRHRIGHHFGERFAADIIPDIHDSTWWSQTSRILDLGNFYSNGRFIEPDSVTQDVANLDAYRGAMHYAQTAYRTLRDAGVPLEDCRQVIPMGTQHNISWTLNLAALKHIVGKRGCWIAQLGMWEPVIRGMIEQVRQYVHPHLGTLIRPPCINQLDEFSQCPYLIENERRVQGLDPIPPCPLYLTWHRTHACNAVAQGAPPDLGPWTTNIDQAGPSALPQEDWECKDQAKLERMVGMLNAYQHLWQRDPWTWEEPQPPSSVVVTP